MSGDSVKVSSVSVSHQQVGLLASGHYGDGSLHWGLTEQGIPPLASGVLLCDLGGGEEQRGEEEEEEERGEEEESEGEEKKGVRLPVQLLTLRLVLCLIKKGMTLKERF